MGPFIAIAANLFPQILQAIAGSQSEGGKKVIETVEKVVKQVTGTEDDQEAARKIAEDPVVAAKLRTDLANIALEETRLRVAAEQKERDAQRAAELKEREAQNAAEQQKREAAFAELKLRLENEQNRYLEDLKDTAGARDFQKGLVSSGSMVAWVAPALSIIVTVGFFFILLMFIFFKSSIEQTVWSIPPGIDVSKVSLQELRLLAPPPSDYVMQIINISVGALAAAFATVMSFWLGSSQSSQNKDRLVASLSTERSEDQKELMKTVITERRSPPPTGGSEPTGGGGPRSDGGGPAPDEGDVADPVKPAPAGLLAEIMPQLIKPHRHFDNGVQWSLTSRGISIDGAAPMGTPGEPSTVRKIFNNFREPCLTSARRYGVPIELIVATIATESGGNPNDRRPEPQINDESVGLMQTLVKTARAATGRKSLRANDLLDPATSIDAGTAYIASQRPSTHFDAPLVAAAYNAGSIRRDDRPANRWKLHCFPPGTGAHVDRFVAWFADCMRVSAAEGWAKTNDVPSFASAFGVSGTGDKSGPDFPPPPSFRPLVSTEDRQQLFGTFSFRSVPRVDNPENIEITDGWEDENIVTVEIPIQGFPGHPGPLKMRFHKKAKDQLVGLWLSWEKAGLLDRILTYDGAFVPRFMRGSRTSLSNHAFGTAFDINAAFNPLKAEPALVGEKGSVREMVTLANKWGFFWGGHFKSRPDGMHFEVAEIRSAPSV
ncbi:M15 family metallopeptidase [Bradyrhizobium sp. WSM 1738]|uniref:M15 family metallopeptidase n=1 Tax=Bradyrhizobium hereditatis TaxID=2821405 RepID=UPI001CE390FC|nr:M15 family metallopeptidase [Bradyrhizobium hereditatis]MCA6115683.1 M15 family metallopeptidase [Bradyrhizobium hereditatis]